MSTSVRTSGRARTLGAVAAVAVLALTGCGALRPGVAVQVGDETISASDLDTATTEFCTAIEPQLEQQAESIQNSFLRSYVAGTLALRSVAEQMAEEHGVEVDDETYLQTVTQLQQSLDQVPEEARDTVIEIESAQAYVDAVQRAVGETLVEGGNDEEIAAAGREEFDAWISENGVDFDPSLNTVIEDGVFAMKDQAVSVAVSDTAKTGLEEQPNAVAARDLTRAQRCGR